MRSHDRRAVVKLLGAHSEAMLGSVRVNVLAGERGAT